MKRKNWLLHAGVVVDIVAFASTAVAADGSYSPYVGRDYPSTVYWGDTHLHTSRSVDAYTYGDSLGPTDAYRLARGKEVTASNGMRVRLRKPLDFLVIADHAECIGMMEGLAA